MITGFDCPHCGKRIKLTVESSEQKKQSEEKIKCLRCIHVHFKGQPRGSSYPESMDCTKEVYYNVYPGYLVAGKKGVIKAPRIRQVIDECTLFEEKTKQ